MIKNALLLAAGMGSRLKPLTDTVPKCLVPIKGVPLLEIWLHALSQAGVENFFVNTYYLPEQVERYVRSSAYASRVTLLPEVALLGTLGSLRSFNDEQYKGGDLLVAHADNLINCSWRGFFDSHAARPTSVLMTMMTFKTDSPSSCGILEIDESGRLINMHEKVANPPGNTANGAVYVMSEGLMKNLSGIAGNDISRHLIPNLYRKILCHPCNGYLRDIGTPEAFAKANEEFAYDIS
jgi:mannose-1-phosphate guanylyltransferase